MWSRQDHSIFQTKEVKVRPFYLRNQDLSVVKTRIFAGKKTLVSCVDELLFQKLLAPLQPCHVLVVSIRLEQNNYIEQVLRRYSFLDLAMKENVSTKYNHYVPKHQLM